jgi:hypothetical protein
MGVQWNDAVEEILNLSNNSTDDDLWPDDSFSDASQSMDELLDRNNSLEQDENVFESLDEGALDEMARESSSYEAFQEGVEDMPNFDAPAEGMPGYMAAGAGILSGAVFSKVKSFILSKISSMRNVSQDNDNLGLDELVDLDDLQNATTSIGNNAARASAESTRNGLGVANFSSVTPPVGVESAA